MRLSKQILLILAGFILLMIGPNNLLADDADCVVGREIAGKATKKFKSDKKEGLKLWIISELVVDKKGNG